MNAFRSRRTTFSTALAALLIAGATAHAQLPAGGAPGGMNAAFIKLFGSVTTFTANVEVQVVDSSQNQTRRMPLNFAALDGKIRVELDVAQIKSQDLSAAQVEQLKEAGMNKIVSIIRPDKKASYVIYPGLQNYAIMPMPKEEAAGLDKNLKLEKTALGRETIDGHACVKNRVLVKDGENVILEATTWNATELKDFPVQIETKEQGDTSTMRFTHVQFARPDAKQFEPPAGYKLVSGSMPH